MKHSFIHHYTAASLLIIAVGIFGASASFGAESNYYLKFRSSAGKTYTAKPDANGKFTFTGVQPGTYTLILAGSDEYFAAKKKDADAHKGELQLLSFSWSVVSRPASSSSVTGNADRESSAPSVSEIVVTKSTDKSSPDVALADLNGDGMLDRAAPQKIREPKAISLKNPVKEGTEYYVIIMQNVIVTSACSPTGTISGFAIKEQGVK
jgi:type VI protein secretion system component Hcp